MESKENTLKVIEMWCKKRNYYEIPVFSVPLRTPLLHSKTYCKTFSKNNVRLRDKPLNKYERKQNNIHWNYYKSLRNQITTTFRNKKKSFL